MLIIDLNSDVLRYLHNYLDYKNSLLLKSNIKFFYNLYNKIYYYKKKKNQKIKKIINKWISIKNSRNISRIIFIEKLINNSEFRNIYLFIHNEPEPHLCFKAISLGPYLAKLFPTREHIFDFFTHKFQNSEDTYNTIMNELLSQSSN